MQLLKCNSNNQRQTMTTEFYASGYNAIHAKPRLARNGWTATTDNVNGCVYQHDVAHYYL